MNRIMFFLSLHQQPPLQFEALKCLTLYIPGPRIARSVLKKKENREGFPSIQNSFCSTPANHDLHPDKMFFKRHVKNVGVVPVIYSLLDHASYDIREQVRMLLFYFFFPNFFCSGCCLPRSFCRFVFCCLITFCSHVVLILVVFSAQHPAARDYLLQNNGLAPLLRFAQPTQPVSMLRKVSFVLACFVGYTHPPGF